MLLGLKNLTLSSSTLILMALDISFSHLYYNYCKNALQIIIPCVGNAGRLYNLLSDNSTIRYFYRCLDTCVQELF